MDTLTVLRPEPKTKKPSKTSKLTNRTSTSRQLPSTSWLVTFLGLALLVMGIALLIPQQTPEQQFYLRIIIALSASGLAAIIPGFFDISIRWLRSSVRAGGAIGIFLLVYQVNPPTVLKDIPHSKLFDVSGKYEYTCTSVGDPFPHGGRQHGGKAYVQVTPAEYGGVDISASGDRNWFEKCDADGTHKSPVNPASSWQTFRGYQIAPDEFRYEYTTRDKEGESTGETALKVFREDGKVIRLEGTFRRCTPDGKIHGTVVMIPITD